MSWKPRNIDVGSIVDADTHIAPTADDFAIEEHIARLDKNGIAASLTWLNPHSYVGEQIDEYNRYVYNAVRTYPDRIIPFGWADPTVSVDHARETVHRCLDEYGFVGVKLNGAQNNYFIDDPEIALPVAEEIARSGGVLAYHIGPDAYEQTHPLRVVEIARRFPETTILMVHMGMTDEKMNEAVIRAAEQHPGMHLVASGSLPVLARKAIKRLGPERVLFGSDAPFRMVEVEIAAHEAMFRSQLSAEIRDLVMGGNAIRLFGGQT